MLSILLIMLFLASPAQATDFQARVVGITDGDTLTVLTAEKKQVKIRLFGVDSPESNQAFGARAKQVASELAFGKDVTILARATDRYGRTVAEVMLPDGRSLNRELVGQGMAWWAERYAPHGRELERLESEARAAKRGLWSYPSPMPPWEWRNGRAETPGQVVGSR